MSIHDQSMSYTYTNTLRSQEYMCRFRLCSKYVIFFCVCIHTHTYTHIHTHKHTRTCMHAYVHVRSAVSSASCRSKDTARVFFCLDVFISGYIHAYMHCKLLVGMYACIF